MPFGTLVTRLTADLTQLRKDIREAERLYENLANRAARLGRSTLGATNFGKAALDAERLAKAQARVSAEDAKLVILEQRAYSAIARRMALEQRAAQEAIKTKLLEIRLAERVAQTQQQVAQAAQKSDQIASRAAANRERELRDGQRAAAQFEQGYSRINEQLAKNIRFTHAQAAATKKAEDAEQARQQQQVRTAPHTATILEQSLTRPFLSGGRATKKFGDVLEQVGRRSIDRTQQRVDQLYNTLKLIGGTVVLGGLIGLTKHALELDISFQKMQFALNSGLLLTFDIVDKTTKRTLQGADAYVATQGKAKELFDIIRKEAAKTNLTFQELSQVFSENLGLGARAGFGVNTRAQSQAFVQVVARIAQLAKAQGLPGGERQLTQEVRALLTGESRQGATVERLLGFTPPQIKKLQEEGKFADELVKRLNRIDTVVQNTANQFMQVFTTLQSEFDEFLRRATLPVFEKLTDRLKTFRDRFTDEKIAAAGTKLADVLGRLFDQAEQFANSRAWATIQTGLQWMVDNAAGIVTAAIAFKALAVSFDLIAASFTRMKQGREIFDAFKGFTAERAEARAARVAARQAASSAEQGVISAGAGAVATGVAGKARGLFAARGATIAAGEAAAEGTISTGVGGVVLGIVGKAIPWVLIATAIGAAWKESLAEMKGQGLFDFFGIGKNLKQAADTTAEAKAREDARAKADVFYRPRQAAFRRTRAAETERARQAGILGQEVERLAALQEVAEASSRSTGDPLSRTRQFSVPTLSGRGTVLASLAQLQERVNAARSRMAAAGSEVRRGEMEQAAFPTTEQRKQDQIEFRARKEEDDKRLKQLRMLQQLIGRDRKDNLQALHAEMSAEILLDKQRYTIPEFRERALATTRSHFHRLALVQADEEKIKQLQNQKEIAEGNGQKAKEIRVAYQLEVAQAAKSFHEQDIDYKEFQQRRSSAAQRAIREEVKGRREVLDKARDFLDRYHDAVKDQAEKQRSLQKRLADFERETTEKRIKLLRAVRDAQAAVNDAIRDQRRAMEDVEGRRVRRGVRNTLLDALGVGQDRRGSVFGRLQEAQSEEVGQETGFAGTASERRQIGLNRAFELVNQAAELAAEGKITEAIRTLEGGGITLSGRERSNLVGVGAVQSNAEFQKARRDERRAVEDDTKALSDAARHVEDSRDNLKVATDELAKFPDQVAETAKALQDDFNAAVRDSARSFRELAKAGDETIRLLVGLQGGRSGLATQVRGAEAGAVGQRTAPALGGFASQLDPRIGAVLQSVPGAAAAAAAAGGTVIHLNVGKVDLAPDTRKAGEEFGKLLERDSRRMMPAGK